MPAACLGVFVLVVVQHVLGLVLHAQGSDGGQTKKGGGHVGVDWTTS